MTTLEVERYSGGVDGNALTTGTTTFDAFSGTGALVFDDDLVWAGWSGFCNGQTASRQATWNAIGSQTYVVVGGMFYIDDATIQDNFFLHACLATVGGATACQVGFLTSGSIRLRNSNTTQVAATPISTQRWYYYAWVIDAGTSTQTLYLWPDTLLSAKDFILGKATVISGAMTAAAVAQVNTGLIAATSAPVTFHFSDTYVTTGEFLSVPNGHSVRTLPPEADPRFRGMETISATRNFHGLEVPTFDKSDFTYLREYVRTLYDITTPAVIPELDCYWGVRF